MKVKLVYSGLFLLAIIVFLEILYISSNPEKHIVGEWKEMKWEYEKVNKKPQDDTLSHKHISAEEENLIRQNLIIHKAETWTFFPDGVLKLSGADTEKYIDWRVKGRGNILLLKYKNNTTEVYNITHLSDGKMILNFETDLQARGIAKLTFKKNK